MTSSIQNAQTQESDVSIIRREFVDLTGDHFSAVILNQLLYWTLRVKDFDRLLEEERYFKPDCNVSPRHGWIYKTAQELNEETMLGLSPPSIRKYLKLLIDQGWIDERNNPTEKWDRTAQYRVNLRKLQEDLIGRERSLPEAYLKAFGTPLPKGVPVNIQQKAFEKTEKMSNQRNFASNERNFASRENLEESFIEATQETAEMRNQRNFASNERNFVSRENLEEPYLEITSETAEMLNQRNFASNERNFASNEKFFASNERNFASNQKIFGSNTENTTETTQKNTNIDYQQRLHAQENFSNLEKADLENLDLGNPENSELKNSCTESVVADRSAPDRSISDKPISDKSVAEEMVGLWERHVVQNLAPNRPEAGIRKFQLTEQRKGQLESLFSFHFQNDMRLWERFCLKVKGTPFLMGGGPNGWVATLDWMLRDGSVLKVLGDKYGGPNRAEQQDSPQWKLEKIQPCPVKDAEKAAILASIKDPVWKMWCTRLAEGVRLNDFRMAQEPLSAFQLQQMADAYFLECEDERLVWVGSLDQRVLNKIEDLRLKISWVFKNEYPKASTLRTRLEPNPNMRGCIQHE